MQPTTGFVNIVLGYVGLGNAHTWLSEPNIAIYPCVFASVWAGAGIAFILILGATEQVPVALYEAAQLDGASAVRRFFSVTLPMVRPVVGVVAMLEFIWAANGFTLLWAMTRGGPGYATSILSVLIYREGFVLSDYGQSAAMAVLGGIVLVLIGSLMLRLSRSSHEGAA
jgi:raffinose/stachyose/melibiose transport system permease protein